MSVLRINFCVLLITRRQKSLTQVAAHEMNEGRNGKRVVSLPSLSSQGGKTTHRRREIKMGRAAWLSKDKASPIQNLATESQVMRKGPRAALQGAKARRKAWRLSCALVHEEGGGGQRPHMRPEGCSLLIAVDLYSCRLLFQALFISP